MLSLSIKYKKTQWVRLSYFYTNRKCCWRNFLIPCYIITSNVFMLSINYTKRLSVIAKSIKRIQSVTKYWLQNKGRYTWAPQTVHNTPVKNILKGHFYIILKIFFYKKPTSNFKFQLNLSMLVGGTCRKRIDRQPARRTQSDDTRTWSIVH